MCANSIHNLLDTREQITCVGPQNMTYFDTISKYDLFSKTGILSSLDILVLLSEFWILGIRFVIRVVEDKVILQRQGIKKDD